MFKVDQLLGSHKSPLLATQWKLSPSSLVETVSANLINSEAAKILDKSARFTGEVGDLNWNMFAEYAASKVSSVNPGWSRQHPGEIYSTDSEVLIDDLPLLQYSMQTLELMRVSVDMDLGTALDRPRSDFLNTPGGALTLLDLEMLAQNFPKGQELHDFKTLYTREKTLEEIAARLVDNYRSMDGNRLGSEWTGYLLRRFSWGQPKSTLDLIGSDAGLTRERVRQLVSRVSKYVGWRRWPMPTELLEVIKLLNDNDFIEIETVISESSFAIDDDWTPEELLNLTEWLGYPHLVILLEQKFEAAIEVTAEKDLELNELAKMVRKSRSPLGLLDANSVYLTDGTKVDVNKIKLVAERIYDRYYEAGDWILCGVKNSLTTAERKSAQQLSLVSPLSTAEVYEGIERHRRYKSAPSLPPPEIMIDLLCESCLVERHGDLLHGLIKVPIDGLNAWLANELLNAPEHVLHKDLIYREAIQDRKNVSSLTVLFLYNPLIRPVDNPKGLVRLIGSEPSEEAKFAAKTVASALAEPSDLEFEVYPESVLLSFQLGSYAISTGIYQASPMLRDLWPIEGAEARCFCEHKTEAIVKIKNSTQMLGMHPLIAHMLLEHNGQIGSVVSAKLQNNVLQALRIS